MLIKTLKYNFPLEGCYIDIQNGWGCVVTVKCNMKHIVLIFFVIGLVACSYDLPHLKLDEIEEIRLTVLNHPKELKMTSVIVTGGLDQILLSDEQSKRFVLDAINSSIGCEPYLITTPAPDYFLDVKANDKSYTAYLHAQVDISPKLTTVLIQNDNGVGSCKINTSSLNILVEHLTSI